MSGRSALVLAFVVVAAGCTALQATLQTEVTVGRTPTTPTSTSTTTTATAAGRACVPELSVGEVSPARLSSPEPGPGSVAISAAVFPCADEVVVVDAGDFRLVAVGAQLAAGLGGPLLLTDGAVSLEPELGRLAPRRVVVLGDHPVPVPPEASLERVTGTPEEIARWVYEALDLNVTVNLADTGTAAAARILHPLGTGGSFWVPPPGPVGECDRDGAVPGAVDHAGRTVEPRGDLWLVDACSAELALAAAAAARAAGDSVLLVDGRDLRASRELVETLPGTETTGRVVLAGEMTPDADWQVAALLADQELPGGGLTLFPGRRIVALYGNPGTPALGVMGEQGPAEAVVRAREVAEPYGADGHEILPAFEIIATVASAKPTGDGDYSFEMSIEELLPWVETAAEEGLYVTLDLQPGRTDFLTQARRYEELLLMPHVGLALDPEWRLKPDQVHLRQIGSVDADEVNRVIEWLAGLVRDHHLPQKLLILHQFQFSMITNRELIETPPELAVMVHVDGQGPIHSKYDTYAALTGAPDAGRWWWGWKNFYDEDSPTPTPEQVLGLDPVPVYVSYQ